MVTEIDTAAPRIVAAYAILPDTVYLTYDEVVDVSDVDGTGFELSAGSITANTDPGLQSAVIRLFATGAAEDSTLTYDGTGTVTDRVSNGAGIQQVPMTLIENGTVPQPEGADYYEVPPEVSAVTVTADTLPAVIVSQGDLWLDFSGAPSFVNATKSVTLTDEASEVVSTVNRIEVTVAIPAGTEVTADAAWDGRLHLPALVKMAPPPAEGVLNKVRLVFHVGSDPTIHFDRAVRMLIPGEGGPANPGVCKRRGKLCRSLRMRL